MRPGPRRSGKLGQLNYIEVRGVSSEYPDPPGSPMHWRQNRDYSGLNILMMGIFYEALERWVFSHESLPTRGGWCPGHNIKFREILAPERPGWGGTQEACQGTCAAAL